MENGLGTQAVPERENRPALEQRSALARISEQLATNSWVRRLARLGYVSKGLMYVIVGVAAALAVVKIGGRVRGARGALSLLVAQPLGRLIVAVVAVGLCGFILRRFIQIFVPPTTGTPPKPIMRVLRRTGYALSGLAHIGIALIALGLLLGLTSASPDAKTATRGWTTLIVRWRPLNGWLVLLIGLALAGVAVFYFYKAVSRRFTVDLEVEHMSRKVKGMAFVCGVAGYAGRGLAFLITGSFLVYAGWHAEDAESRRVGDILGTLEAQPFGTWILIMVAVGLICYGMYLLFAARYLRLIATW